MSFSEWIIAVQMHKPYSDLLVHSFAICALGDKHLQYQLNVQ